MENRRPDSDPSFRIKTPEQLAEEEMEAKRVDAWLEEKRRTDATTADKAKKEVTPEDRELEERRIKEEEQKVRYWTVEFFEVLKKYFLKNGSVCPGSRSLPARTIDRLAKEIPVESIKNQHDLEYFISQALLFFGLMNEKFQNSPKGKDIYSEEVNDVFVDILQRVITFKGDLEKLISSPPVLYREDENGLKDVRIQRNFLAKLPMAFSKNPTRFIESLDCMGRDETKPIFGGYGGQIGLSLGMHFGYGGQKKSKRFLGSEPYDFTRVRRYRNMVFKRVDLKKVAYGTEELDQAKEVGRIIERMNDPRIKAQNFVGVVYDQGNVYLVSEFIEGQNLNDWILEYGTEQVSLADAEAVVVSRKLQDLLRGRHIDLENRNIIVDLDSGRSFRSPDSMRRMTVIDFETRKNT